MGGGASRTIAGLTAVILAAAVLAAAFEVSPPPDWPDDYPGHDDFTAYDADMERWGASLGGVLALSIGFICDLVPLAWIAWRGIHGRQARLMLAALAAHVVVSSVLIAVGRSAESDQAVSAAVMWMLASQALWLAGYLFILSRPVPPRAAP